MTAKEIFNNIQGLNITAYYVTEMDRQVAEQEYRKVIDFIPEGTLAHKIITDLNRFGKWTAKQLWVIAFELEKSASYAASVKPVAKAPKAKKTPSKYSKKQAVKETPVIEVGARVSHRQGEGIVSAVDSQNVTILFDNGTEKQFIIKFAQIEVIK